MKNSYFKARLYAIILIAVSLLNACKDPDDLGMNIQPPGDLLNAEQSDTTTIIAYSFVDDSVQTNYSSYNLLGSIKDPIFGRLDASFCTNFEPQTYSINFGTSPVIDSVVLVLTYKSSSSTSSNYYGDTIPTMTVKVYELDEPLPDDSIYSNQEIQYNLFSELGSYSFNPRPNSHVLVGSDTISQVPQLRIRLNNNFADKFFNADTTVFNSVGNFQDFFHGFYLSATPVNSDGAICYFELRKKVDSKYVSRLYLYYHNSSDTTNVSFVVGENSVKFNKFEHYDYQDAIQILKDQIHGNKTLGDSLLFLQSTTGISVKLNFPYLLNWYNQGKISINRAELIVSAEDVGTYMDDYYAATKLGLAGNDTASHYYTLIDDDTYTSGTFFGGSYNSSTKEYHFNITRQIQSFLTNSNPRRGMYLTVSGKTTNATRVVVKGPKRSNGKLRLRLTYTKLY